MADGVEIRTDVDLRELGFTEPIPGDVLKEIGNAFRDYRHKMIMAQRQMHDLSQMPPLKPETIRRKSGVHAVGTHGRGLALKAQSVKRKVKGRVSQFPSIPLVDTGNLLDNVLITKATLGELVLDINTSRHDIGIYHQYPDSKSHLPQRVHFSWNPIFLDGPCRDIIIAWMERRTREAQAKGMHTVG